MNPLIETLDRRIIGKRIGSVYVIHFDTPFHHAQHYVGWTQEPNIERRMDRHFKGAGARIMRAVSAEGITWSVVRVFHNVDRHFERWLKDQKRTGDFCPVCSDPPRQVRNN